ncbi:MAG: DUF2341 domain-containing protein [Candidatus Omnitrophica bacterium]|nr:DUF2341 domain-containing protein [Candidatus Omnitrophota bacterium]
MNQFKRALILGAFIIFSCSTLAEAASRYWVGGDGSWSQTAHWSTSSGGGGGATVPGTADIAIFNRNSGTGTCTLVGNINIGGIQLATGNAVTIDQNTRTITIGTQNASFAAGTFQGGSANIDVNGTFALSGGTFTSTSATMYCGNTFTISGGTFNHGSGTVIFDTNNFTINPRTAVFNNVTFNAARTFTISSSRTLTVDGVLNLTNGTVNTGTINARGQINLNSGFDGGTTALTITGTADQTFTGGGSASTGYFLPVTINKTGGTLTLAGIIRTRNNWTYTAGTVVAGTSTVVFVASNLTINPGPAATPMGFNNVTFNGSGRTFTITSGRSLVVNGLLELRDGIINTGNIYAKGDITLYTTFDNGSAPLTINGDGDQNFTGAGSATAGECLVLTINKSGGTLYLFNTIRTGRNWTYTAGNVNAGDSTVVFGIRALTINPGPAGTPMAFNNVTFYNAYAYTITSGRTLVTTGTLELRDGTVNTGNINARGNINLLSTFDGGSAPLTINGDGDQTFAGSSTITAGTFLAANITKTTGTLYLSGTIRTGYAWTYNSGAVDAGASTVVFAVNSYTINPGAAPMEFYNVTFNGSGRTYTITSGRNLVVNGTLELRDGAVNTGNIHAKGNITLYTTFDSGSAPLTINGAGDQTLTGAGSASSGDFLILTIDKTSGTLYLANIIRTGRNWTYTAGNVDAGTSTVVFGVRSLTINPGPAGAPMEFYNVTFYNAYTYTITSGRTLVVNGTLTFNDGGAGTGNISARGDINVNAGADVGSAVLILEGASDQRITCAGGHTTNTVNINNSAGIVTITGNARLHNINLQAGTFIFLGGATYTIDDADAITTSAGTSLQFSGSSGSLALLRSDRTAQWDLRVNAAATCTAEYVDVQYSNASGGKTIVGYASIDRGNNTNWSFPAVLTFVTSSQTIIQNVVSPVITVQVQDGSGAAVTVPTDLTIDLSTDSSTGLFSADPLFIGTVNSVIIRSGTSSADLYYKDSTASSPFYTITASENPDWGFTDATLEIVVESRGTWKYKREITISSAITINEEYQVLISLDTTGLSPEKMQTDGSDIRIYDSDDLTTLSYWIEEDTVSSAVKRVWVKVPSLAPPGRTIYLYYGNTAASTGSSITNTFVFGDDFSGASINTAKWNTALASPSYFSIYNSDNLRGTNTGTSTTGRLQSRVLLTAPFILEASAMLSAIAANGVQTLGTYATSSDCFGILAYPGGNPTRYYYRNNGSYVGPYNTGTLFNNWHLERVTAASSTSASVYVSGSGITDTRSATNTISNEPITLGRRYDNGRNSQAYNCYWDWIIVRKYASAEPATSVGEETMSIQNIIFTTAPQTLRQDQTSDLMTVQTVGYDGTTPVNVSVDTIIQLFTSSGGGYFAPEDDPANWNEDSLDVTIPAGQNSADFYYKDSEIGTPTISAAESPKIGWVNLPQIQEIKPAVNTFWVEASGPQIAGENFTLEITAIDGDGNIATEYAEEVDIGVNYVSPSAGSGILAVVSTSSFTEGVATITDQSFSDCGTITIMVTSDDGKTGSSNNIVFLPYDFMLEAASAQEVVNAGFELTVTARNAQGQTCPNYEGLTNLSAVYISPSIDQSGAITPASLDSDNYIGGIATLTAAYDKWGTIKIRAADAVDTTRIGETAEINFIPKDFSIILAAPPASRNFYYKDEEFIATVTARDENGGTVTNYQGTADLSSSGQSMSTSYTFLAADLGVHGFSVSIPATGTVQLTVRDTDYDTVQGVSDSFEIKEAKIKVFSTAGPLGTVAVAVKVLDNQDNVITEDDSTTFMVTLDEPNDNHSASSDATAIAARMQGGSSSIYILDTEAEAVTVTPYSDPELTAIAGTVNFGSFQGRGIGIDLWREVK